MFSDRRPDFFRADDGAHGESAGNRFGDAEDIRLQIEMIAREHFARAAETGLDFVDDEKEILLVAELSNLTEVIAGSHVNAALALHDLQNDAGRIVAYFLCELVEVVKGNVA